MDELLILTYIPNFHYLLPLFLHLSTSTFLSRTHSTPTGRRGCQLSIHKCMRVHTHRQERLTNRPTNSMEQSSSWED